MNRLLNPMVIVAGAVLFHCAHVPAPRTDTSGSPVIKAANEMIWLAPLVNNCGISDLSLWPRDSIERMVLMQRFDDMASRLLTEFRRCEKYGRYTMVDDSCLASLLVRITLGTLILSKGDSILLPIGLRVTSAASGKSRDLRFAIAAPLTEKNDATPFHYAGLLCAEIATRFPYRPIVRSFYVTDK